MGALRRDATSAWLSLCHASSAPLFASLQDRLGDSTLDEADVNAADTAKALLLRFDDSNEQCRELAVDLLLAQLRV